MPFLLAAANLEKYALTCCSLRQSLARKSLLPCSSLATRISAATYKGSNLFSVNSPTSLLLLEIEPPSGIQDLVKGGLDLRPPTLSNCHCCLTSPFSLEKLEVWSRYLRLFHFRGFGRPTRATPGPAPEGDLRAQPEECKELATSFRAVPFLASELPCIQMRSNRTCLPICVSQYQTVVQLNVF